MPNSASSSCAIHHYHDHHDHHQINIDDDNDDIPLFKIDIVLNLHYKPRYAGVIITHEKTKSFSFTLPLEVEDPQLIDSHNIYEVLWDPAVEELQNLDVDHRNFPGIIDEIASAYLRGSVTDNGDNQRSLIVVDVEAVAEEESEPNKELIKGLLLNSCMTTLQPGTNTSASISCAICMEEAAGCGESGQGEEELVVGKLRCNHVYHVDCLVNWVCTNARASATANNNSCPLCRCPLFAAH